MTGLVLTSSRSCPSSSSWSHPGLIHPSILPTFPCPSIFPSSFLSLPTPSLPLSSFFSLPASSFFPFYRLGHPWPHPHPHLYCILLILPILTLLRLLLPVPALVYLYSRPLLPLFIHHHRQSCGRLSSALLLPEMSKLMPSGPPSEPCLMSLLIPHYTPLYFSRRIVGLFSARRLQGYFIVAQYSHSGKCTLPLFFIVLFLSIPPPSTSALHLLYSAPPAVINLYLHH